MYDEEALRPIREALEQVRERLDFALARLKSFDELRCMRWRCVDCGYIKHFTRPNAGRSRAALPQVRGKTFVAVQ